MGMTHVDYIDLRTAEVYKVKLARPTILAAEKLGLQPLGSDDYDAVDVYLNGPYEDET